MSPPPADEHPADRSSPDRSDPSVPRHDATLFDEPDDPWVRPFVPTAPTGPGTPDVIAWTPAPTRSGVTPRPAATPARTGTPQVGPDPAADAAPVPVPLAPTQEPRSSPAAAAAAFVAPPAAAPLPAAPVAAAPTPRDVPVAPTPEPDPLVWPPEDAIPSRPAPSIDTGRLYRSAGADGPAADEAIPALGAAAAAMHGQPLSSGGPPPLTPRTAAPSVPSLGPLAAGAVLAPLSAPPGAPGPAAFGHEGDHAATGRTESLGTDGSPVSSATRTSVGGLTWTGVAVVEIVVTVLLGLADVIVSHQVGVIAGLGLVAVSIYCALTVRPADIWAAVVIPPLAWLVTLLTVGQLTLSSGGSLMVRESFAIFTGLALNAPWIIAATGASLVIVLVRRMRLRRATAPSAR